MQIHEEIVKYLVVIRSTVPRINNGILALFDHVCHEERDRNG